MKVLLNNEKEFSFDQSNFCHVIIDQDSEVELNIEINNNKKCQIFVQILQASKLNTNIYCKGLSNVSILFWNDTTHDIDIIDEVNLDKDSYLSLSYGELSLSNVKRVSHVHLNGEGSSIDLHSAMLTKTKKEYRLSCVHHEKNTTAKMSNYLVMLEGGTCILDAIGKIDQGASGSKSHQISKGLTFGQVKDAVILPELLIDENDVEASHATTLGQIDENQMVYLQSRGLTKESATQLITYGYLIPIASAIEDETLKQTCIDQIEKKVNELCLMSIK